jgi:hypothetical protein
MRMNLSEGDLAPELELNEIIWRSIRGANSPMPPPRRVHTPGYADDVDNDDAKSADSRSLGGFLHRTTSRSAGLGRSIRRGKRAVRLLFASYLPGRHRVDATAAYAPRIGGMTTMPEHDDDVVSERGQSFIDPPAAVEAQGLHQVQEPIEEAGGAAGIDEDVEPVDETHE